MTREEAIKVLRSLYNVQRLDTLTQEEMTAVAMAIKALEQEPSGDLISRSALMIALMDKGVDHIQADDLAEINQIVSELPSVNPQEPFKPMVEIDLDYVIKQKYIEREVLDKIRAEIEDAAKKFNMRPEISYDTAYSDGLYGALNIIDKYREQQAERRGEG